MNRKEFLRYAACAAAATAWKWDGIAATAGDEIVKHDAAPRNRRPYTGVDWANAFQIRTTTHGHADNQKMLDAYLKRGFEFLTISNYYPSAPRYPLKDVHQYDFRINHNFPVTVKGKRTNGPFDWNARRSSFRSSAGKNFSSRCLQASSKLLTPNITIFTMMAERRSCEACTFAVQDRRFNRVHSTSETASRPIPRAGALALANPGALRSTV